VPITVRQVLELPLVRAAEPAASVSGAGACGLVVELGSSLPKIEPALIDAAERLGLPLVALHREMRFVGATEAVGVEGPTGAKITLGRTVRGKGAWVRPVWLWAVALRRGAGSVAGDRAVDR
jgi:hypothetical protein